MRDIVLSYEKDDPAQVLKRLRFFNSTDSNQTCPYEDVAGVLREWGTPRAKVNRSYIVQEGGIDLVFTLYGILTKIHWDELNRGSLHDLLGCLTILWNICETYDTRMLIHQRGAFDLMVKSLAHPVDRILFRTSIFPDMVIGCISK